MSDTWLSALIGSVFASAFFAVSGSVLLTTKFQKNFKNYIMFLFLVMTSFFSYFFLDNAIKVIAVYIVTITLNKLVYKRSLVQCSAVALISYLLLTVGEVIVSIFVSMLIKFGVVHDVAELVSNLKGNIAFNLFISLTAYLLLLMLKHKLRKLVSNIKENGKSYIFSFTMLLIIICALLYKLFSNKYAFNETFVVNCLLILAGLYIGFVLIKQIYDKNKISEDYEKYVEYSKQSEKLVEDYSISQHENKNELIIIRSMVHKTNKKLIEYLDEIISNKDNVENSWIRYLRYIPFGGLKGIIHNKISEMKESNIKVFLNVSKTITKTNLKNLSMKTNNQLSKIIGVFLDNAKEAAISSSLKEVSINVFVEKDFVVFEISNSYDGYVDIDKIYESRYTNKGKGRGYGLSLVKSIVEESRFLVNEVESKNGYFIQKLKVKN